MSSAYYEVFQPLSGIFWVFDVGSVGRPRLLFHIEHGRGSRQWTKMTGEEEIGYVDSPISLVSNAFPHHLHESVMISLKAPIGLGL